MQTCCLWPKLRLDPLCSIFLLRRADSWFLFFSMWTSSSYCPSKRRFFSNLIISKTSIIFWQIYSINGSIFSLWVPTNYTGSWGITVMILLSTCSPTSPILNPSISILPTGFPSRLWTTSSILANPNKRVLFLRPVLHTILTFPPPSILELRPLIKKEAFLCTSSSDPKCSWKGLWGVENSFILQGFSGVSRLQRSRLNLSKNELSQLALDSEWKSICPQQPLKWKLFSASETPFLSFDQELRKIKKQP